MEKYHQYMKDCSMITTLGGKTSSGITYEAGRFAAVIDTMLPKLDTAASEKLADHVYYLDHERGNNAYRQCNQPSALLVGLPNLSKVIALRAVGVYTQLEGISTTVCGYGCDMSTIGNAGSGRPSTGGGNLTIVNDKTGIFATADYAREMWGRIGPSLTVTKLTENDPVYLAIKGKISNVVDMDVYYMTNTKTPSSSYRVYVPVPERLMPEAPYHEGINNYIYQQTELYSYSDGQGTLKLLGSEEEPGYMFSAETDSIQYIAVVKKRYNMYICVLPPNNNVTKPAQVKSLKAKNIKKKKVKLTWKKVSGAKGYQVQYSLKKKFPSKKTKKKTTTKRTLTIKKLTKKKTYYFRVRAYKKKASGSKVYGKWSKVVKVKIRK